MSPRDQPFIHQRLVVAFLGAGKKPVQIGDHLVSRGVKPVGDVGVMVVAQLSDLAKPVDIVIEGRTDRGNHGTVRLDDDACLRRGERLAHFIGKLGRQRLGRGIALLHEFTSSAGHLQELKFHIGRQGQFLGRGFHFLDLVADLDQGSV